MSTVIKIRRDTAANWTSANPTLASGEPALETDTRKWKIGDGATAWTSLGYMGDEMSAFMVSLLDDANAAAFMSTLGITSAAQTMLALASVLGVRYATVQLNNAEIKAYHTTGKQIVAACAAGFANIPLFSFWDAATAGGAYTNITAADSYLGIWHADSNHHVLADFDESEYPTVTHLLGAAGNQFAHLAAASNKGVKADIEAKALLVKGYNADGDLTGGHAANTLDVHLLYTVLPV